MADALHQPLVVIPCFNEIQRLDPGALDDLVTSGFSLMFVDDGSTDGTGDVLDDIVTSLPAASVLHMRFNQGKAEAVREGLLEGIRRGATIVGYLDADLSTPPSEYRRLVDHLLADHDVDVVFGSRVALLGRQIERRAHRHYLGRVFATLASVSIGLRVYDTQCGAKAFRVSPTLVHALSAPFKTRWAFDVELLGRLLADSPQAPGISASKVLEVPLLRWHDVPGSHLRAPQMARALVELAEISWSSRVDRHRRLAGQTRSGT